MKFWHSVAIQDYVSEGACINKKLWNQEALSPTELWLVDTLEQICSETESLREDLIVYRGIDKRYLSSEICLGFISTSLSLSAAKTFKDKYGQNGILLTIILPKGSKCLCMGEYSQLSHEYEVLLPRYCRLETKDNYTWIYHAPSLD